MTETNRRRRFDDFAASRLPALNRRRNGTINPNFPQTKVPDHDEYLECACQVEGKPGALGPTPPRISDPPPSAPQPPLTQPGNPRLIEYKDIRSGLDGRFIALHLRRCELDYINNDFENAAKRLLWLYKILSSNKSAGDEAPVLNRTRALLEQLSLGLDYYGVPGDYSPLLRFHVYKNYLNEIGVYFGALEKAYFDALGDQAERARERDALQLTLINLRGAERNLQAEFDTAKEELPNLISAIERLLDELEALYLEIKNYEDVYRGAVAATYAQGCGLSQIATIVTSIVAVASAGGAVVKAALAAKVLLAGEIKDDQGKLVTNDLEELKYRFKWVSPLSDSVDDLVRKYAQLETAVNPAGHAIEGVVPDDAKILADRAFLDAERRKLLEAIDREPPVKEKDVYKALLNRFFDAAITRNGKIVEYLSIYQRLYSIDADLYALRVKIQQLNNLLARNEKPERDSYVQFLMEAHNTIRLSIIRVLYQGHRALNYLSLRKEAFPTINDRSWASLGSVAASLIAREERIRTNSNQPPARFPPRTFRLREYVTEAAFVQFIKSGTLTVSIPISDRKFRGLASVRVTKARVRFVEPVRQNEPPEPEILPVVLIHNGFGRFVDDFGAQIEFSHKPCLSYIELSADGMPQNTADFDDASGNYAGVSPFASWSIRVIDYDSVRLARIKDIVLEFEGWQMVRIG